MTKLLCICLCVACSFASCSIEKMVNKKYPPKSILEAKLLSTCNSLKQLDPELNYDAEVTVSAKLIDSLATDYFKEDVNIDIDHSTISSITIDDLNIRLDRQEIRVDSRQRIYLKHKLIEYIDFHTIGSSFPYYQASTVYFNPGFNRIKIDDIKFKKWMLFRAKKPIVRFLNRVFNNYLDNANKVAEKLHLTVKPTPVDSIDMASILDDIQNVEIINNSFIKWKEYTFSSSLLINNTHLGILLREGENPTEPCTKVEISSISQAKFDEQYTILKSKWEAASKNFFDELETNINPSASLKIANHFLSKTFNEAMSQLNFTFAYTVPDTTIIVKNTPIDVRKPDLDCSCRNLCDALGEGRLCRAACKVGKIIPVLRPFVAACESYRHVIPNEFYLGDVGGIIRGNGKATSTVNSFSLNNNVQDLNMVHNTTFAGRAFYNFVYAPATFVFYVGCQRLEIRDNTNFDGDVETPLTAQLSKDNSKDVCELKLKIPKTDIKINAHNRPYIAIFKSITNVLQCPVGLVAVGRILVLGKLVEELFNLKKFENLYNALSEGQYNHEYKGKQFSYPMKFKFKAKDGEIHPSSKWKPKSLIIFAL